MRILLASEDLPTPGMGGLARHVLALARALITDGHTVDLMGSHPRFVVLENNSLHPM